MYLYDLNHFTALEEDNTRQPDPDANPLLPPVPAELPQHLVVDAGQEVRARLGLSPRFRRQTTNPKPLPRTLMPVACAHVPKFVC